MASHKDRVASITTFCGLARVFVALAKESGSAQESVGELAELQKCGELIGAAWPLMVYIQNRIDIFAGTDNSNAREKATEARLIHLVVIYGMKLRSRY